MVTFMKVGRVKGHYTILTSLYYCLSPDINNQYIYPKLSGNQENNIVNHITHTTDHKSSVRRKMNASVFHYQTTSGKIQNGGNETSSSIFKKK